MCVNFVFASTAVFIQSFMRQENLVLKDFNIANEAGGPGKAIVKTFTVNVTSHTLKIHFYWAGKGTTGIPFRGVYGPLISAISVVNSMFLYSLQVYISVLLTIVCSILFK